MSANERAAATSQEAAEEILRTIYGDDFAGCKVSLQSVAEIIERTWVTKNLGVQQLLELYEKLVEAISLLSRPPEAHKVTDPAELRTLLSQRLDTIRSLSLKAMETTARAKKQSAES